MTNQNDNFYWNDPKGSPRRVMYKAAGLSDVDIRTKLHIGIANSFMEGSPGTAHLRHIAEAVKQGVWAAGGMPVEFGIPATCGNVSNGAEEIKYELVARDVVAMSVEFVTKVHHFDALIILASCDNIIAGGYLAAARLDIPTIIVTGGSMQTGNCCGKSVVAADLDIAVLKDDIEGLNLLEESVCPSYGACPSMGTANTMQILGEVLNLVLPGTASIPAADNLKLRKSREAGSFIVDLAKRGIKPSELITKEVLRNAIMVDMAIAGSTNAVLHILTMAIELDLDITIDDFDRLSDQIKCISGVIPSGPYSVIDFYNAGGVLSVMKQLETKLYLDVPTLLGCNLKELLTNVKVDEKSDVIRSLSNPYYEKPGLKILKGNLSVCGAIVRPTGVPDAMSHFKGKAKTFNHELLAFQAIESGKIKPGDIMIIRYEGCKGAPGMKEIMLATDALVAKGLDNSVGLITDARFSGFNHGAIIGHVSPEAYEGGTIALVEDGDLIEVDIPKGLIHLDVTDEILAERKRNWTRPEPKVKKGVLTTYANTCRPAHEGGAIQDW